MRHYTKAFLNKCLKIFKDTSMFIPYNTLRTSLEAEMVKIHYPNSTATVVFANLSNAL